MNSFFLQFSYDKAQETSIQFHIKDKHSEKKIDSTLNGMLFWGVISRIVPGSNLLHDNEWGCLWCVFPPVVTLYNCSLGREDCSLCKNTDFKYNCVWCARSRSCVFHKLCPSDEEQECPDPVISAVSFTVTMCINNIQGRNIKTCFKVKMCLVDLYFMVIQKITKE